MRSRSFSHLLRCGGGLSHLLRRLRSPSVVSSKFGSRSLNLSCDCSSSRSLSRCDEPGDGREEHLLADIVKVSWIHEVCDLSLAPSENRKICEFWDGLDPDEQPSSSYHLPISDASANILGDIDSCISSSSSGMCSKVSKLLPYPGVRSYCYYCFEEEVVKSCPFPRAVTEFGGLCSFDNLHKTDVVFLALEVEDLEATARTIIEVTLWMD